MQIGTKKQFEKMTF